MYLHIPNSAPSAANISLPEFFYDELNYQECQYQKILDQIEFAFKRPPTKANVLPGQRLIKQGCKGRKTSLFPSRKAGGLVPVESQLELAHAVGNLERTSKNYRSQAIRIELPGGKCCYPDFVVLTNTGFYEVHEVKPDIYYLDEQTIRKLKIVEKILHSAGIVFRIIDSSNIPSFKKTEKLLEVYSRGHVGYWTKSQISLGAALLKLNPVDQLIEGYELLQENDLPAHILEYLIFHDIVNLPALKKSMLGEEV
ncbi:hypothetical protein [Cellvibrio sp. pealriver]|uniref:hypothetical protein n=1 Tax=Cellvibrio sp. pealriver TaxID=1622269 RepID=UPI00066FEB3A|nr:hypothetical protein [Cellvibrio sp. pealriver]